MGPTALFDKSFLQSLSLDESVWFDNYFISVITPLFFVETLADLEKSVRSGRTPEDEVGIIADKMPEFGGATNAVHSQLCCANLIGDKIAMDGRIILSGGKSAILDGQKDISFDFQPEDEAMNRWRNRKFIEVEREYASVWRNEINQISFEANYEFLRKYEHDVEKCKNLSDLKKTTEKIVREVDSPYELMKFVYEILQIPHKDQTYIFERYKARKCPPLLEYAPYAAHVVEVESFFNFAVSRGFLSADRPSNRIDIAYLFYLPFCQVFISGDKFHKRVAPLFVKEFQTFVWAPDLKSDLKKINDYYSRFPENVKEKGILSFASRPPMEEDLLTAKLWDKSLMNWRVRKEIDFKTGEILKKMIEKTKQMLESAEYCSKELSFDTDDADSIVLKRMVRKKKGSWYQLPKDLEVGNKKED